MQCVWGGEEVNVSVRVSKEGLVSGLGGRKLADQESCV